MAQQTNDPLESLLQQADAAAGPPPQLPGDLPQRVHRLARRARHIRLGIGVAAAVIAVAVGLSWLFSANVGTGPGLHHQTRATDSAAVSPSDTDEIAALQAEVARLAVEVESLTAVVRQVRELEADYRQLDKLRRELVQLDAAEQITREVDEAVFVMLYDADYRLEQLGQREAALNIYRNVIHLFPHSHWADVAKKKLSNLQSFQGGSL